MEKLSPLLWGSGFYIKGEEVSAGNDYLKFRGSTGPSGKADTTEKNTYEKNHHDNGSNAAARCVV